MGHKHRKWKYTKGNKGKILEDLIWKRLFLRGYYQEVLENVLYNDAKECGREIDDLAIHHKVGHKHYIIIVECKLGDRRTKAVKQLTYSREHIRRKYPKARIFCLYAHNYNYYTHTYKINWIFDYELDAEQRRLHI